MKRLVFLLLAGTTLCTSAFAETKWGKDLEAAKKLAAKTGQLILVDFFAEWCGPCKQMEREVFQGPRGPEVLKGFILVKQDVDTYGKTSAAKYKVTAMPTLHVMRADGKTLLMTVGGLDADTLKEFLGEAKKRASAKKKPAPKKSDRKSG